jgi:hypothetical protein
MQFKLLAATSLLALAQTVAAFPKATPENLKRMFDNVSELHRHRGHHHPKPQKPQEPEMQDGQLGRIVKFDPVPSFIGTKMIPGKLLRTCHESIKPI